MKFSRWYPGTRDPAISGVYQRDVQGWIQYAYWDGWQWWWGGDTPRLAVEQKWVEGYSGNKATFRWRGLAEKPKEAK